MGSTAEMLARFYPLWHAQALCLGMDDSLFFGASDPGTRPPYTLSDIKRARKVCARCPVALDCLQFAVDNQEEYGVWAGSTIRERREILVRSAGESRSLRRHVVLYIKNLREQARPTVMLVS